MEWPPIGSLVENTQSNSRYAMIHLARADALALEEWEARTATADPNEFRAWVDRFVDQPDLLRSAPPAEVAALIRVTDRHPGWLDPQIHEGLRAAISEQIGAGLDVTIMRGSRTHAPDMVRQAQHPELAHLRAGLLDALDAALQDVSKRGHSLPTALGTRLLERGLVTLDPELGEPVETILRRGRPMGAADVPAGLHAGITPAPRRLAP